MQAQATRAVANFYIPDVQKCKSRPEYRSKKAATAIASSCKEVKLKKMDKNVDLNKVCVLLLTLASCNILNQ